MAHGDLLLCPLPQPQPPLSPHPLSSLPLLLRPAPLRRLRSFRQHTVTKLTGFNGKLGMEHFSCFPNLGKINVQGLMVKRKSFLYHLSDSMAIKHAFEKLSGTWLLHLNASSMQNAQEDRSSMPFTLKLALSNSSHHGDNQSQKSVSLNVADNRRLPPISNDGAEFLQPEVSPTRGNAKSDHSEEQAETCFLSTSCRNDVKKRNIIGHRNPLEANRWTKNREVKSSFGPSFITQHQRKPDCGKANQNDKMTISEHPIEGKEHESLSILENSRKSSQTISVTGIISRFFSELDEVDSCYYQPKHFHKSVQVHKDELRDSNIRILTSQPDYMSNRKTVVSDTDTQCSFAKQQEENTADRTKIASKVKKQQLGSRKLVSKKSSLCTSHISSRMHIETSSCKSYKHQVGKRLVQAANNIQISRNGKRSATKFLSKCKNLTSSDSALLVKKIAFDVDDFVD